jgi:hypothetical protein
MTVRSLKLASNPVNDDALRLVEETLARVKAGEVVAVAIVEVRLAGSVATAFSRSECYHKLNSGCARLAVAMASIPDDG